MQYTITRVGIFTDFKSEDIKAYNAKTLVEALCSTCNQYFYRRPYDLKTVKSHGCRQNNEVRYKTLAANGAAHNTSHGLSKTYEYKRWRLIYARCYLPSRPEYKWYGGRGIKMCESFIDFNRYIHTTEPTSRPDGYTLDRINGDGNYSCGYCKECKLAGWPKNWRWADTNTQSVNKPNTKIKFTMPDGRILGVTAFAREIGHTPATVRNRFNRGWDIDRIISTPKSNYIT